MSIVTTRLCENCGVALPVVAPTCPSCAQPIEVPLAALPAQQGILAPGMVVAGRYRIEARIGAGGFGMVYKATDTVEQNRLVALKRITLSALNAQEQIEATDSYNREVMLPARLRHKHLAALYDHFTDAENWYLVLEYIDGQTLEDILTQAPDGCLPIGEVLHVGQALCDVLGYLHLQDPPIIFRDVKPANIIRAKDGQIYLIDFGIARHYQIGQSKDTGPLGSPGYAAPEQYGRAQTDRRTDIYGLGATLQTLLTGKDPLEIRTHGLPLDCEIPAELHTLILRMTDPDPDQRPSLMVSVSTVLEKLQKRYPHMIVQKPSAPFAWQLTIWVLLMQVISIFLFHLLMVIYFTFSLLIIGVHVGMQLSRGRKNRRGQRTCRQSKAQKYTFTEMHKMMKDSLSGSADWVRAIFISSFAFLFHSLADHFQFVSLFIILIYLTVSMVGLFSISQRRLPFQKIATASVQPQDQQQAQPILMYQRIHHHKP